jgi:hypothetical protein
VFKPVLGLFRPRFGHTGKAWSGLHREAIPATMAG